MDIKSKILKSLLQKGIEDIDKGNCNMSPDELEEIVTSFNEIYDKNTEKLSKYQACKYLRISRATFDNYVREGKIPKGIKEQGFKELFWFKKDLDVFVNKNKK